VLWSKLEARRSRYAALCMQEQLPRMVRSTAHLPAQASVEGLPVLAQVRGSDRRLRAAGAPCVLVARPQQSAAGPAARRAAQGRRCRRYRAWQARPPLTDPAAWRLPTAPTVLQLDNPSDAPAVAAALYSDMPAAGGRCMHAGEGALRASMQCRGDSYHCMLMPTYVCFVCAAG
jgi:hypothetical protein